MPAVTLPSHRARASGRPGLTAAIAERDWLVLSLLSLWAIVFGALVNSQPHLAVAALAAAAVVTLGLTAPLTVLVVFIALTAVVPYKIEHMFAVGGTGTSPGLSPSDALLAAGMLRAILTLPHMRLDRRRWFAVALVTCFLAVVLIQCVRGLQAGANFSVVSADGGHLAQVTSEARRLLGFSSLLLAIPILEDARSRRRLLGWFAALGLALGIWGLVQWFGGFNFSPGAGGVQSGVVSFTTAQAGSLQGGLFVYPIAIVLSTSALLSGQGRRLSVRLLLLAILITNVVDCVLGFERTVWIATCVGILFLVLRSGTQARVRASLWIPLTAAVMLVSLALIAPKTLRGAEQRLSSVSQYSSDDSVRYRVIESQHVIARINAHPLTGSALGATIFWGRPYALVEPANYSYSHVGYLWLAWKLGIPGATLIVLLMLAGALWRGTPDVEPEFLAFRTGAQAVMFTMLIMAVTFPIFNSLEVPAVSGVLLAAAAMPPSRTRVLRG